MSEEKGDVFDSIAKYGGVGAAGIFGSVFFPAIILSSINGWLEEQMAANQNALVLSCALAAIAGAGIACSIAIPVMKWRVAARIKAKDAELEAKDVEFAELEKQVAELEKRPIQGQRTVMTETDKRNRTREFLRSKIAEMTASQVRLVMDASMGAKLQIEAQDAIELAGIGVAMMPTEATMHCYSDGDSFDLRLTPEMNKAVSTETQFFLDEAKSKIEGFERLKEKKL
ncbi:hypothetical protein ACTQZK_01760 [Paraeggerthella sp. LCP19S3_G8]|uniref:hypothetical protein n=1 Tax=Paraeggerthella sp. LCP19S3_G8 TaxID=3440248 RepID=UPI003F968082